MWGLMEQLIYLWGNTLIIVRKSAEFSALGFHLLFIFLFPFYVLMDMHMHCLTFHCILTNHYLTAM